MLRSRSILMLIACIITLALAQPQAQAQVKPFKISGAGIAPTGLPLPGEPPRDHWAVGNATELGKYSGAGQVQTDTANFNADGTVTGEFGSPVPFVFTAANGDKLACYYGRTEFGATTPGTFTLVPVPELGPFWYVAYFVAEFVPYDPMCTGRFKNVGGGWVMYATTDPFFLFASDPVPYSWEGRGSLDY
jgi:hypothetical protein